MAPRFLDKAGKGFDEDTEATVGHLEILANVDIEKVPFPEEGELSEEDAWTISPSPTRARMNSIGSVPSVTTTIAPAQVQVQAPTVDTSGLERMISSRLDMVEDVLRMVETKVEHSTVGVAQAPTEGVVSEGGELPEGAMPDDVLVTADGQTIEVGSGVDRLMGQDEVPLLELYEAQALAANPFLIAPDSGLGDQSNVGAPTIAALLLDNISGRAAVSFTQKAMDVGMLTQEEGTQVLAIVQLAAPGEASAALDDHLKDRDLLRFSALVSQWRKSSKAKGE